VLSSHACYLHHLLLLLLLHVLGHPLLLLHSCGATACNRGAAAAAAEAGVGTLYVGC
jgi:hypothetical protein